MRAWNYENRKDYEYTLPPTSPRAGTMSLRHQQQQCTHLCGRGACPSARHPPNGATDPALARTEHRSSGSSSGSSRSSSGCSGFKKEGRIRVLFRIFHRMSAKWKMGLPRREIAVLRKRSPGCVHTLRVQRPFFLVCTLFCP